MPCDNICSYLYLFKVLATRLGSHVVGVHTLAFAHHLRRAFRLDSTPFCSSGVPSGAFSSFCATNASVDKLFISDLFSIRPQLNNTKMTLSPRKNIFDTNLSLLTPLPPDLLFSVHISFTFSSTILQWRSKALTRARSFRLLRHDIRTWVWVRVAVWRIERGPVESSWASTSETSYSLRVDC